MCYCEHCRANFKAASGSRAAPHQRPADPARRAYLLWRQERLFELWRLWDGEVRKINPDSCVIPNTGGGALELARHERIGELAPTLMADRQSRRGLMAPWANGKNAKEFRATMGNKPVVGIFSVGLDDATAGRTPCRPRGDPPLGRRRHRQRAAALVHEVRRHIYDPRWLKPVEDLYAWCHGAERTCATSARSRASRSSTRSRRRGSTAKTRGARRRRGRIRSAGTRRWSRRGSRSRWCTTACLTPEHLAAVQDAHPARTSPRFPTPSAASSAQFVARGGGLVATSRRRSATNGAPARGLRARRPLRRDAGRAGARARCTTPTCASSTTGRRAIRSCAGSRTRRGSSTASGASRPRPGRPLPVPSR
jgi:hypothetical protein